ncbi:MAG: sulfur carrier protein ThiS adenylyltransferase ThiF [Thermodesulfobacteriota bacterium]
MSKMVNIVVNGTRKAVPAGTTVAKLRERFKEDADVIVLNCFPADLAVPVKEGDELILIRRGEIPGPDELEACMVARHSLKVHERMKRAAVGIAGLGGLGSNVAIALARMGVGMLVLADFDVVEPTNLNRQQYSIEHLGLPKTEAMSKILVGINPYLSVVSRQVVLDRENIPSIFGRVDIIVECFDSAEAKAMIIDTVGQKLPDTYLIGASGVAGYGASNSIVTTKLGERVFIVGDLCSAAQPGRGLMAPRVGIAAHHQANLVVSLLVDGDAAVL